MDRQAVYNKVKAHLLAQGGRSMIGSSCAYRGNDGMMCAVGCLITDKAFRNECNTRSIGTTPAVEEMLIDSGVVFTDYSDVELLHELQNIHDSRMIPVAAWKERLEGVARNWGLEP